MCGILGIATAGSEPIDSSRARQALTLLAGRGPDDSGWHDGPGVALGHTRLSIMDLTEAGRQPMSNDDGTVQVTFNGEIYRFWELRRELEALGHRFVSRCDTEVIVRGYEQWGRGVLDRIDGMFALALWDTRTRTLLLARDRLGKKPLFWSRTGDGLAFCSLMRPLVDAGLVEPTIDLAALREYLFLNYIIGPRTIFAGVELLPPGTWLEFSGGQISSGHYWRLDEERQPSDADPQQTFEELLTDSVRSRLVSDAPVGMFLSGGVDSALIAALAQREGGWRQLTFSVGFEAASYDERPKARRAAAALGTEHHEIVCRPEHVPEVLPAALASADHLLADQSLVPLTLLAGEARRLVKVVLTGDGGDELLAGYSTYRALEVAAPYVKVVPATLRRAAARAAAALPDGDRKMSATMLARRFMGATTGTLAQAHASWRSIWSHDDIDGLLGGLGHSAREWQPYAERFVAPRGWPRVKSAVHADVTTWLVDSILAKVDRATMAHGLEARSPLLDARLAEHCFDVLLARQPRLHSKQAARRFAARMLGPDLAGARKEGFQAPISRWLGGPLRDYLHARLDDLEQRLPGLFDRAFIDGVEQEHARGRRDRGLELWSLVVLSEWLALFPNARLP